MTFIHTYFQFSIVFSGVGAILAFVVGAIIFMTTLDKGGEDTAIRFRKTSGETEVEILRATDDNTDDEEEEI